MEACPLADSHVVRAAFLCIGAGNGAAARWERGNGFYGIAATSIPFAPFGGRLWGGYDVSEFLF